MAPKSPHVAIMICNKIMLSCSVSEGPMTSWDIQRWFANQVAFLFNKVHHPAGGKAFMLWQHTGEELSLEYALYLLKRCRTISRLPRLIVNSLLINFPDRNASARYSEMYVPLIKMNVITLHWSFHSVVRVMISIWLHSLCNALWIAV